MRSTGTDRVGTTCTVRYGTVFLRYLCYFYGIFTVFYGIYGWYYGIFGITVFYGTVAPVLSIYRYFQGTRYNGT